MAFPNLAKFGSGVGVGVGVVGVEFECSMSVNGLKERSRRGGVEEELHHWHHTPQSAPVYPSP